MAETTKFEAFLKAQKVITSCNNLEQQKTVENYLNQFLKIYKDDLLFLELFLIQKKYFKELG